VDRSAEHFVALRSLLEAHWVLVQGAIKMEPNGSAIAGRCVTM
jgi:hypothetical protein